MTLKSLSLDQVPDQKWLNSISVDEILQELREKQYKCVIPEKAYTTEQWAEKLGFGIKKTRRYLKNLIINGKMESMRIPITDIADRKNYTYVYREL